MDAVTGALCVGLIAGAIFLAAGCVAWLADLPAVQDWLAVGTEDDHLR